VNDLSLVSMVDRGGALSSAVVVRSWSVVLPHSPGALVIPNPRWGEEGQGSGLRIPYAVDCRFDYQEHLPVA
jgi:hypothetical protein